MHAPSRFVLVLLLTAAPGCSWLFHKPRPDPEIPPEERAWLVRCEWFEPDPAAPAAPPRNAGRDWATDASGSRLALDGRLEDGFLVVDTVQPLPPGTVRIPLRAADAVPATRATLERACSETMVRVAPETPRTVHRVTAARPGENIDVSLVLPDTTRLGSASRVVVFGDSLSDDGNLKERLLLFPDPPYWLGRFSNGPVWPEYLNDRVGLAVRDDAFGGAISAPHDDIPNTTILAGIQAGGQYFLTGSVSRYVNDYVERDLAGGQVTAPRDTVFVIWSGGNDYLNKEPISGDFGTLLDSPAGEAGYYRVVDLAVGAVEEMVRKLAAAGGRRFVVFTLPDLGRTPGVLYNDSYHPRGARTPEARRARLSRKLTEVTDRHNAQLRAAVKRLRHDLPTTTILITDMQGGGRAMIDGRSPDQRRRFDWGLDTRTPRRTVRDRSGTIAIQDKCYHGGYLGSGDPAAVCAERDRVFFWDSVHPTTATHCWIAWLVARDMAKAGWLDEPPSAEAFRAACVPAATTPPR
jgi:phospholipase/lecithinase/hemolysin